MQHLYREVPEQCSELECVPLMEYQWTLFIEEMKKVLSSQAAMIDMQLNLAHHWCTCIGLGSRLHLHVHFGLYLP